LERVISSKTRQAVLLLLGTAAVFLVVGSATADPSKVEAKRQEAQQVLQQIQLMDSQLEKAVERYNHANDQLASIQTELTSNARHLVLAKGSLKDAQRSMAQRLVSLYTSGGNGTALEVILGAQNLDDLLTRLDTVERVSKQDAQVVRAVTRFKAEVQARKVRLTKARVEQRQVVAQRAAERSAIEGQLASRQRLLASIKDQIQQLQAEEAARQAQLRADAERRLQAERAAAQAQAAAPVQAALGTDFSSDPSASVDTSTPVPSSQYGGVVGVAMQYLGTPYVWGGSSPGGFDCSGFVMYVYGQVGVSLPHYAAAQYSAGVPVSRDQLQPGDLVFFDGLGHVGIYIGGGQFVHAPHTGDVVKISSLYDSWYAATYVGARRIL